MSAIDKLMEKPTEKLTHIEYAIKQCNYGSPVVAETAADDLANIDAELAALRERVKVLEEAIKPFAEIPCLENFDNDQLFDPAGGVLAGDVRKARAALRGEV